MRTGVKCFGPKISAPLRKSGDRNARTRAFSTPSRARRTLSPTHAVHDILHAHLQDMNTAQFFANVILDLNKGSESPTCYLPWSWTQQTPGPLNKVCTDVF
jgi:hypothetical protein